VSGYARPSDHVRLRGRRAECRRLDGLVDAVRSGESRVLVLRGEPVIGKTALLDYLAGRAAGCRLARAAGVQSEMELAFAGLHQLCAPMLDHADRLPAPQRAALHTAFGLSKGPVPDRFLLGLAVLGLLSDVAGERPLICLVDDEQWLDHASAQTLGFVGRRLAADPVGLVFAARVPGDDVAGLPGLAVEGLRADDARALLDSVVISSLEQRIRDQIVAETHGNPLALLELPRGLTPAQLAGGFGLPATGAVPTRIEDSFRLQLDGLTAEARRLLQLAAADPSGDPLLVWQAAGQLGIPAQAGVPAVEAGLVEFGPRVKFRHPLARSAAYRSASTTDRRAMHGALAQATDPQADPDRRAWHRSQAAAGPDEDVAAELERSAGRAQARGGLAAAAAFLERAALLTPDPTHRGRRLLAAAQAMLGIDAHERAQALLDAAEACPLDERHAAQAERLRGQLAFDRDRNAEAQQLILTAARRLAPVDAALARETQLEVLWMAVVDSYLDSPRVRAATEAVRDAPPRPHPPRAVDDLLDALALRLTEGHAAAAPAMAQVVSRLLALPPGDAGPWLWWAPGRVGQIMAFELWDLERAHALASHQVRLARDTGALSHLVGSLGYLVVTHLLAGELGTAAQLAGEQQLLAEAAGFALNPIAAIEVAVWQGEERTAAGLLEEHAKEFRGDGAVRALSIDGWVSAVLHNSFGRPAAARDAARRALEREPLGYGPFIVSELAEGAARTGDTELVETALRWMTERTQATPTDWALGITARIRALLASGAAAEPWYRESVERLGRTSVRAELARSHLLYGEWLRRENRRVQAREQLRAAHQMLTTMGMAGFAERARRELAATGETVQARSVSPATAMLTPQEAQVARLARDGLTNPEIGTRLYISARTAQYHLSKVFTKLGIISRSQLAQALPEDATAG
jgi:DNA-binding CsgD family transcriptional regulator